MQIIPKKSKNYKESNFFKQSNRSQTITRLWPRLRPRPWPRPKLDQNLDEDQTGPIIL